MKIRFREIKEIREVNEKDVIQTNSDPIILDYRPIFMVNSLDQIKKNLKGVDQK